MLDTFYTEPDGWLELADMYASCQQYTYALQSLSHSLLLSPQNPSYFLQYAETAYLAEDVPLALKTFLQVVDMTDDDDGDLAPSDSIPTGITLRAWFGAKLVRSLSYGIVLEVPVLTCDMREVHPQVNLGTACSIRFRFSDGRTKQLKSLPPRRPGDGTASDSLLEREERVTADSGGGLHRCCVYSCKVVLDFPHPMADHIPRKRYVRPS